ncbi:MAG: hypothetical protein FGM46_06085 [Ferruginibacter sp.]|nr:hypothetical protein [Ferruginibacter sp.]
MTACIRPYNTIAYNNPRFRSDIAQRLIDYETAFRFWLNYNASQILNIVFIDNSGYPLDSFKAISENENVYNRNIEFLQIVPKPIPPGIHYGYSELEMIDIAAEQSRLINQTKFFIKVTGRLYFPKLKSLLNSVKGSTLFLADSRDYSFAGKSKRYILTTLLVVNKDFFNRKLKRAFNEMTPGETSHFETLYYRILKPIENIDKRIILRFPFNVNPVGYGAHWNVNYKSFTKRLEYFIRGIFRFLLPQFRI